MSISYRMPRIAALPLALSLAACGGGDSSPSKQDQTDNAVKTGRLLDSAVEGIEYRTESRTGITGPNGEFSYLEGETVVFGLGDLSFPAVRAAQILTPLELAGTGDIRDTGVVNMARLLQSLDKDCDPSNGITISGEALLSAAGLSLDFEDPDFDQKVINLVANGGQTSDSCKTLIPEDDAVAHLQETLDQLDRNTTPPIGGGLEGKVGVWAGEGQQQGVSWTIRIDIGLDEQTIEYPSLSCGGTLDLVSETENQLRFRETITYGVGCADQGIVELTDESSTSLVYRYYWDSGSDQLGELGAIGQVEKEE